MGCHCYYPTRDPWLKQLFFHWISKADRMLFQFALSVSNVLAVVPDCMFGSTKLLTVYSKEAAPTDPPICTCKYRRSHTMLDYFLDMVFGSHNFSTAAWCVSDHARY